MGICAGMNAGKGVGKELVKGWQPVGKRVLFFHGLSMLYQCLINTFSR